MKREVLADADAVAGAAAGVIAADARAAVAARGRFVMAVSGGHTPWIMLRALASEDVPWKNVHVVQVDERVAPAGDPDRNLTHLRESLLAHAPLPPAQIHAMPVESADLEAGAREYARTLEAIAGSPPVLDLAHLGLGPDGHTASLVPGDPVLAISDRDVGLTGVYMGRRRMTLTYPVLDRSRRILWLVTGAEKVPMLARLMARRRIHPGRTRAPGPGPRARRPGGGGDGRDLAVTEPAAAKRRILILGGGFAGAYAALHLEKKLAGMPDVEIVIASHVNFVLFTPMLHEVAGGDVSVTDIVQPLRKMLRHCRILIVDVTAIDLAAKRVRTRHAMSGREFDVDYDQLVLALGAVTNFFHTPGLEEHALTMKTLGDAILVRNRAIDLLEIADNAQHDDVRQAAMTVVVAGGGFAGVETIGAINDLLREASKFYPRVEAQKLRLLIVDPGAFLLPELSESLGRYTERQLTRRGVEVRMKTRVAGYDGREVAFADGSKIAALTLVWTAGTTPPPILAGLPCGLERGRVVADDCLRVPGWPGVWALGDCALVPDPYNPGKFYPPTAQHAIRQAATLADNVAAALRGGQPQPFRFKILGLLAAIGRRTGVAEILGLRFSGLVAWMLWRGIYLSKLPGLQKKVRVTIDWILDLFFSKDLVQLPTLRSVSISEAEKTSSPKSP